MLDTEVPFDAFQPYYDLMVDWEHRLAHEAPFFQRVFGSVSARRVLDCACGTGHHARFFSRWGLEVVGSDLSPAMVEAARAGAARDGANIRIETADFRELPRTFSEPFDAVICTGNSLPLAGSRDRVRQTIQSIFDVLSAGGVAVVHSLNFALMPDGQVVYEGPRVRTVDDREILFLKVFRRSRRHCGLDVIALEKRGGEWSKVETRAEAWALEQSELEALATDAGFVRLQFYGGYEPKPFDPKTSRDLILVARREKA